VHQLRVGLRRLRSALRVFRDILPEKRSKRLARRARRAMRKLGRARDWDVLAAWLAAQRAPSALLRQAQQERARARALARSAVADLDLGRIEPRSAALDPAAVLGRLERKARRQTARDARERHKLRIRVKRLRYASECFGRRRPDLEALQEVLGELNDIAVARRLLRKLGADAPKLYRSLDARERMKTSSLGQLRGRRG
jgi:CHAD domain-containing protein